VKVLDSRKMSPNVFSVEGIRQKVLVAFEIETVRRSLRGHRLENRDNEPLEFLDNEENVRLTNAGRARCDEYILSSWKVSRYEMREPCHESDP
jgi:hypothetical protein